MVVDLGPICGDYTCKFFKNYKLPGGFRSVGVYCNNKYIDLSNFAIKRVVYNEPATIMFFDDGTKTVCKAEPGDKYNPEYGFMMCLLKKLCNSDDLFDALDHWVPKENLILNEHNRYTATVDLSDVRAAVRVEGRE